MCGIEQFEGSDLPTSSSDQQVSDKNESSECLFSLNPLADLVLMKATKPELCGPLTKSYGPSPTAGRLSWCSTTHCETATAAIGIQLIGQVVQP